MSTHPKLPFLLSSNSSATALASPEGASDERRRALGCGLLLAYNTGTYDSLESVFQSGGELMGQNSGEGRMNSIPT